MSDKVYRFKIRRMERLLRRVDAAEDEDEDDGRWITTENGHHVHLSEKGEPDKGNPHVIEKMMDESGSEESSGKKKKRTMQDFVDLIDKFPETLDGSHEFWRAVEGYLKEAPKETKIGFKGEDSEWIKIEDGYWINSVDGNIIDNDEMLEMFSEEEFGMYPDDDVGITYEEPDVPDEPEQAPTEKRVGRSEKEKRMTDLLDDGSEESMEKLGEELRALPEGSVLLVKKDDYWGDTEICVVKRLYGDSYQIDGDSEQEEDDVIDLLERSTHEFDVITPDDLEVKKTGGYDTSFFVLMSGVYADGTMAGERKFWDEAEKRLEEAPDGTTIEFPYLRDGKYVKRTDGGHSTWHNDVTGEDLDIDWLMDTFRETDFWDDDGDVDETEVEYREPTVLEPLNPDRKSVLDGCRRFTDQSSYSHAYQGDGQEQIDFFYENSNFDELLSELDDDQREAFEAYTSGELMRSYAHGGWREMPEYIRDYVLAMDEVMDQATLDEGIVVTRLSNAALLLGYDNKQALLTELKAMVGKKVVSRGFMSCGAADEGLSIGNRSKKVEYKIAVPGGTTGAGMWLGDYRVNAWGADQREFCLNRDTEYEVGSVIYDPERDLYQVELRFVRRLEHDYGDDYL